MPRRAVTTKPARAARGQLHRRDELLPAMRAARQPAQDIFGADDASAKLLGVRLRVERRGGRRAETRRRRCEEGGDVGDMLDHLHRQHDVEIRRPGRQLLGRPAR